LALLPLDASGDAMTAVQLGLMTGAPLPPAPTIAGPLTVDDIDLSVLASGGGQRRRPGPAGSALVIITSYIPAEALGFYVTATALLRYPHGLGDGLIAASTLLLVALLVLAAHARIPAETRSKRKLGLAISFALVAAGVYIAALPQSFAHEWRPYTSAVGAVVVIGSSILLPTLGELLHFTPTPQKRR
jgi:hypothetical protein